MKVDALLKGLFKVISEEAARNPDFAERLGAVLHRTQGSAKEGAESTKGRGGRRAAAVLDPISVFMEGEAILRDRLLLLNIEQLRDIVAEYGMDPGKLVLKWKSHERVVEHIIKFAESRASKGDAFR